MTARNGMVRALAALTFVLMVTVNALANILPINGITTGEVSDAYPNLFAPAGLTFAIWGLIYLLLLVYSIYQLGAGRTGGRRSANHELLNRVSGIFAVSSIANSIWIFAWHYRSLALSLGLMLVILVCLIMIMQTIRRERLTNQEKMLVKLPFGVYFGWITVATIANVTTWLVSVGWGGFGLSETTWAVAMIVAGLVIGLAAAFYYQCSSYGLVIIWAYAGIVIKHSDAAGFGGQYPAVRMAALAGIAMMSIAVIYILLRSGGSDQQTRFARR